MTDSEAEEGRYKTNLEHLVPESKKVFQKVMEADQKIYEPAPRRSNESNL